MTAHGWLSAVADGQLVTAGLALMLAVQQQAVRRWEGRGSSAGAVSLAAGCAAGLLVVNAVLFGSFDGSYVDALMLARTLALSALTLSVVRLAAGIPTRPPPAWLGGAIVAVVAARLALWVTTDLLYEHRVEAGLPVYGPLIGPLSALLLALLLAYLLVVARHRRAHHERAVLVIGVLGSLALAVASLVCPQPLVAEALSGYLALPALSAVTILIWQRQEHAHRDVRRFADRQRALADLSRQALTAPVAELELSAQAALRDQLPAPLVPAAVTRLASGVPDPMDVERLDATPDGQFVTAVANVLAAAADRSRANVELEHRAQYDELTGLPNRRFIRWHINQVLRHQQAGGGRVAVACCNLDRFTTVNDAYGHAVGDQILEVVGHRLLAVAEPCDTVGRFAADEFVVVCSGAGARHSVDALSDRIHAVFLRPVSTGQTSTRVSSSVGVVIAEPDASGVDADTLLRDAVTAMHDAKARGAATGRFRSELRTAVVYRADIERRLEGAVARGEIVVHYQPIVDLRLGAVTGFEALARWRQGRRLVPPAEWIPVAETTDLIHEIGEHVLATAAHQTAQWRREGHDVSIAVNVSARQLVTARLHRAVLSATAELPCGALVIEVTESLALDDLAHRELGQLQQLGVGTALDDFGTGFSALAAVGQLPIDTLKVDRSITRNIGAADGRALVQATLLIAQAIGLTVVAEGVETAAQHRALRELGCHYGQGYLYGRPAPADEAVRHLTRPATDVAAT